MKVEFTIVINGEECEVEADMLGPDPDVGIMGWYSNGLTVTDSKDQDITETIDQPMMEKLHEEASKHAEDMSQDDPDWP